ncbi:hypothetical protein ScPMuIL_000731 [Solemya velum]
MAESTVDEKGWGHIHLAAFKGFIKSVERFVSADPEQIELETEDELHSTPFLIAVTSKNKETVQCLIDLGANIEVINRQNHGAVELCALNESIELLEYFIGLKDEQSEEEAEAAGKCLQKLTEPHSKNNEISINPNWRFVYESGGVPIMIKVAKGTIADESKIPAFRTLLNIMEKSEVQEQITGGGGLYAFVRLLKSTSNTVIQLSAEILKKLAMTKEYAEQEVQNNAVPGLIKVLQNVTEPDVLVEAVDALGNIAEMGNKQTMVGTANGCIPAIITLFEGQKDKALLYSLCVAVRKISDNEKSNQMMLVDKGVTPYIVVLTRTKNRDLQLSAVEAIHKLAENNPQTQKEIVKENAQELLLQLLKRSRAELVQEKTAIALWALAGDDIDEQRYIAEQIEVQLLIEFLNSQSEDLHYIGSEGLAILAQGPINFCNEISHANGIHPLVRLLRSEKEQIVLSGIRTLRYLCVGIAYVPHHKNQMMLSQSRGIKFLIALMVHSRNDLIQVESALTLGYASLGNSEIMEEIFMNADFSYVRVLKMLYARNEVVRLLAGSALAAFAFNNIAQQKAISEQGGVRFNCFIPFLQSNDEFYRCTSAFQVVILARIIPDEEQAASSAAGIKLLVDLLQDSESEQILGLAADCISRLAHTRAGVPSAIIAIDGVEYLSKLLLSYTENVRGTAAIALGYLSYHHRAERELLNKCRSDPHLMKVLRHYCKRKISPAFLDAWKHYKRIGLPPIAEGRPTLVQMRAHRHYDDGTRPLTILSLDDTGNSSNLQSSASNHLQGEDGLLTGRSSRSSRISRIGSRSNDSFNNSQLSLISGRSPSSFLQPEITVDGEA